MLPFMFHPLHEMIYKPLHSMCRDFADIVVLSSV